MSEIRVDTISEKTSANGVAVDGVTLKDGGIAATDGCTITTADNTETLVLKSTDADAAVGPLLVLRRDSSSPADDDLLGEIQMEMENSNGSKLDVISVVGQAKDITAGTEDAFLQFNVITAGSLVDVFHISPTETVFNDASVDRNFRIESNDNATMLVVDGENNRVGFGTNPGRDFQFLTTDQTDVSIIAANNQYAQLLFGDPDDDNIGSIGYNNSTNIMEFTTNAAHQWSIDASGNWLPAATDHGIYLGVSSATAANLLDDYEEGTWTPTLGDTSGNNATLNSSYSSHGYYTKIGRMVHAHCYIIVTSLGSASGSALLSGLPFTNTNNNRAFTSGTVSYGNNLNLGDGKSLGFYVRPNLTNGYLYNHNSSDGGATASCAEISANGEFMMSVTYTIA